MDLTTDDFVTEDLQRWGLVLSPPTENETSNTEVKEPNRNDNTEPLSEPLGDNNADNALDDGIENTLHIELEEEHNEIESLSGVSIIDSGRLVL